MTDDLTFTREEANQIAEMFVLAGGDMHHVFAWDGSDSPDSACDRAWAKLALFTGHKVPAELENVS